MDYKITSWLTSSRFHTIEIGFLGGTTIFKVTDDNYVQFHQYTPLTNTFDIQISNDKNNLELSNRAFSARFNISRYDKPNKRLNYISVEVNNERGNIAVKSYDISAIDSMKTYYKNEEIPFTDFIDRIYNDFVRTHKAI